MCRYQRGSELCQKLARSLQQLTTEEERGLFDFGARHGEAAPLVSLDSKLQALRVLSQTAKALASFDPKHKPPEQAGAV